jgi:hypothetical protein
MKRDLITSMNQLGVFGPQRTININSIPANSDHFERKENLGRDGRGKSRFCRQKSKMAPLFAGRRPAQDVPDATSCQTIAHTRCIAARILISSIH